MAIDQAQLKADRVAIIADLPIAATFGAKSVDCRQSVLDDTEVAAAGGALENYKFSLHSVTDDWTTLPDVGALMTVASIEYRVLRVVTDIVGVRHDLGAKYTEKLG